VFNNEITDSTSVINIAYYTYHSQLILKLIYDWVFIIKIRTVVNHYTLSPPMIQCDYPHLIYKWAKMPLKKAFLIRLAKFGCWHPFSLSYDRVKDTEVCFKYKQHFIRISEVILYFIAMIKFNSFKVEVNFF
jgi:hypothetical protein